MRIVRPADEEFSCTEIREWWSTMHHLGILVLWLLGSSEVSNVSVFL